MNILITSAASSLARSLAETLRADHAVRLTERLSVANVTECAQCALGHDLSTNLLVRGMEAIVHVAEPLPNDSETQQIDYLTRCTYNLCTAAVAEGVKRLVYLSTLDLMTQYDPDLLVGERWRPRPTTSAPILGKHLGERVCREFAREFKLNVVVLRLGKVVRAEAVAAAHIDPLWVDERDVAQAVQQALSAESIRWAIFHIQHESPAARFPIGLARHVLHYTPNYSFVTPSA
jgi:nucleoside-diphosphate-sugar epimerase